MRVSTMGSSIGKIAFTALLFGTAAIAGAQTYTTTDTTSGAAGTSTNPGTPNTGSGGETAMNVAILTASALVALGSASITARRRLR